VITGAGASGRRAVLERLWREIMQVRPEERALIGLDGVDGAGKTRLAAEPAAIAAHERGRPAVTVSIDGFHRSRAERLAAGTGPDGFYRASYRYDAFRRSVVEPLRAGRPIVPAVWDVARDAPVDPDPVQVPPGGIVLVDGIFLQRPSAAGSARRRVGGGAHRRSCRGAVVTHGEAPVRWTGASVSVRHQGLEPRTR